MERYEAPEMEITKFSMEDVITTSGPELGENDLPWVPLG